MAYPEEFLRQLSKRLIWVDERFTTTRLSGDSLVDFGSDLGFDELKEFTGYATPGQVWPRAFDGAERVGSDLLLVDEFG